MGQGQGNREDGEDPEAKGFEGFLGHLRFVGCSVVVKEAWPESRRRPSRKLAKILHNGGQLAAVEVCIDGFSGWEELIMNESATAPPNTEHELLLEAGRFWSRYFFTSRPPHLVSAPVR